MFGQLIKTVQKIGEQIKSSSPLSPITTYKKETGKSFWAMLTNKGDFGEFLSYMKLAKLPGYHKVLFNVYLPKGKGKTTEIDVIFLHETGVYVIESKNYSGWIFGNENNFKWMQTFPGGKKFPFYNPIKQNATHISALQTLLPSVHLDSYKSFIVFSERCTLKKVEYTSPNTFVINRQRLKKVMSHQIKLSPKVLENEFIEVIYRFLAQYSKVDTTVKKQHIKNTNSKRI